MLDSPILGMKKYKELPTGKVVEELIERANRLRERTSILKKTHPPKSHTADLLIDDMFGLESSINVNDSMLTDFDEFDNEVNLLDDLLYGGSVDKKHESLNQSASSSSDSDQSEISLDKYKFDEDPFSSERIQLLTLIRTARLRIDHLDLKKKLSRTNKSHYSIEYQFPVIIENVHNHITQGSEIVKITSKQIESDHKILFSHSSTYLCSISETSLPTWSNSFLIFKIYTQTNHLSQIGFARLSLKKIFASDCLHFEDDLDLFESIDDIDDDEFSIGRLHVMLEFNSDEKDFSSQLNRLQIMENFQTKKQNKIPSKQKKKSTTTKTTKHCLVSESTNGLVVEIFFSVTEARNLQPFSKNSTKLYIKENRKSRWICFFFR